MRSIEKWPHGSIGDPWGNRCALAAAGAFRLGAGDLHILSASGDPVLQLVAF